MMRLKSWLRVVVVVGLMALPFVWGCGAASAPTAPAEIPTPIVLKFADPDDLQINLDTLSAAGTGKSIAKAVVPGDDVGDLIQSAPKIFTYIDETVLIPSFDGIGLIDIPVSETITTFETDVDFSGVGSFLAELDQPVNVKISFADFDYDNSGASEGCSGHTAELPVCARVWLNDARYIAWVFDEYPFPDDPATAVNERTLGSGRFKILTSEAASEPGAIVPTGAVDVAIAYIYSENIDLQKRAVENYLIIEASEPGGVVASDVQSIGWHSEFAQDGPAAAAEKFVSFNQNLVLIDTKTMDTGFGERKHLARFIEGQDYWSGSNVAGGTDTDGSPIVLPFADEQNICAQISTGLAVLLGFCDDLGISVGTTPFIRPVDTADVAIPNDFPPTPPLIF